MQTTSVPVTDRADDSLTAYIADFVVSTSAADIPADVARLGKRSVLDGIGLAFAGAASQTGRIVRRYLASLSFASDGGSTVIGGGMRLPARFAAFANGISIHADDYDDTQLALAKDRVYGLLTHPTAPALPAVPFPAIVLIRPAPDACRTRLLFFSVRTQPSPGAAATPTG